MRRADPSRVRQEFLVPTRASALDGGNDRYSVALNETGTTMSVGKRHEDQRIRPLATHVAATRDRRPAALG